MTELETKLGELARKRLAAHIAKMPNPSYGRDLMIRSGVLRREGPGMPFHIHWDVAVRQFGLILSKQSPISLSERQTFAALMSSCYTSAAKALRKSDPELFEGLLDEEAKP